MAETVIAVEVSTLLAFAFGAINLVVLGPIAWILKGAIADLRRIEAQHLSLKDKMHTEYIHKDHYGRDIREIKDVLNEINRKLDGKADKQRTP